jgi:predicted Zn finger-like uncharacterized protein
MSLATRCPSCGTIFRVVQDQLKISEGWVRCGRCTEVFNALDGLFDLERESPPPRNPAQAPTQATTQAPTQAPTPAARQAPTPSAAPPAPKTAPPAAKTAPKPAQRQEFVASRVPDEDEDTPKGSVDFDTFASTVGFRRDDIEPPQPATPAPVSAADLRSARQVPLEPPARDFSDARFPSELPLDSAIDLPEHNDAITLDDPLSRFIPDDAPLSASFIEAADRQERRERPVWTRIHAAFSVLLLLVMAIQVAVHWRARIALEWPESRPLLEALCAPVQCAIEPLRGIESFAVDGSALNRIADGSGYRLEITLRNRSHLPLATPSVDLNLTDGRGETLARRALLADEFQLVAPDAPAARRSAGTPPPVVPPGGEIHLQYPFATTLPRISGYTVELFYP